MCPHFPFCKFSKVYQRDMSQLQTGGSQDKIVWTTRERNHIVDLIFFKFESLNNMFNLKFEQIDEKNLIVEGYNNFIQSDLKLLYFRTKCHISDYFLSSLQR